jgi:hypothetical protein
MQKETTLRKVNEFSVRNEGKKRKTSNEGMWSMTVNITFRSTDAGHDMYWSLESYLLTYLLTLWSRVLLEKLSGFAAS